MSGLYVAELALVVAAFVGMLHLRKVGDRTWRAHQARATRTVTVQIRVDVSQFIAAIERAAAAMSKFADTAAQRAPATTWWQKVTDFLCGPRCSACNWRATGPRSLHLHRILRCLG